MYEDITYVWNEKRHGFSAVILVITFFATMTKPFAFPLFPGQVGLDLIWFRSSFVHL